ncbi:DUF6351 family protein [Phytoactinopolyspora limicola]|uniref:DUF6351 family protein n=1 Tax=Phytoactinopolyspora limicola TaxID=2715536 RepID=UPI001408FF39|nr:DUF6351 family protein [Phytoactinopolyspora limicola]
MVHPRSARQRTRTTAVALLAAPLVLGAVSAGAAGSAGPPAEPPGVSGAQIAVDTLSGRPDMVTGGDALVQVTLPRQVPIQSVRVSVGAVDVTDEFTVDRIERTLTGLVTDLSDGPNQLRVSAAGPGKPTAELTLVNHPAEGPVFSGPHQQPFACETTAFTMPVVGGNLGAPIDENCSVETRVDYFYRTTAGGYAAWPDGASSYPDNVGTTVTSDGVEVPFIVRMETGTVNRAIYQTSVLHDPLGEPEPDFTTRPAGWNGAAIYTLGGGCTNGWYRQGNRTGGVTNAFMLGEGYAVMSSSLNVFGVNCSDLTAAESAMMVKERFIEVYGPVDHVIGFGSSGGAYQGHQISDNYPGIFDGIIAGASFPEVGFGTVNFITDAWLLDTYFTESSTVEWTLEQQRAVTGFATYATAPNVANGARRISPTSFCTIVPAGLRYHPDTNPTGVRCGVYDHTVNVYGTDPDTGFARRPLDNVGIQYGLAALNDGAISVEQFLDLNEGVGGFDQDANIRAERTVADLDAARAAYQTGRLTNGGGGLAETPIIDYRAYLDDRPNGDIHVRYHTFSMRERLEKANGTSVNHVSVLEDTRHGNFSTNSPLLRHAITQMDAWLRNLAADDTDAAQIDKIAAARPDELVEGCYSRDADSTFIAEELDRDPAGECEQLYPSASFPREVAGESVAADVIKCRRKDPDPADYSVDFSAEQWDRLGEIFAEGVCDYTQPGYEQQGLTGTWLRH